MARNPVRTRTRPQAAPEAPAWPRIDDAIAYAKDCVAGRIPVGEYARLACERFLNDLREAAAGLSRWEFRPDLADRPMRFAEAMPNVKGPEAGRPLVLMPWQRMVIANLFGFVERGTDVRRFRQGIIYIPRGNGKTSFAAPIALFCTFLENDGGAEGYAAAVSREQARILWDTAKEMVAKTPRMRQKYGVEVLANSIVQQSTASSLKSVSSDAKSLDGLNVSVAVCDEIGSHKTDAVYSVLLTAMGKRKQPLLLSLSTATGNNTGIGKQLWDYAVRVLQGAQTDDRLFALIYAADEGDDPFSEATLRKANPSWGRAVQADNVLTIMKQARQNAAQEAAYKTRHLNLWVGADEALFSTRAWRAAADPRLQLSDFEGQRCYIGVDLAAKVDLAAVAIVFPKLVDGKHHWTIFLRAYLNEAAVAEARNAFYPGWAAENFLTVTPGSETDFGWIGDDILDMCRRFDVRCVSYDSWQSTPLGQMLEKHGINRLEYRPTVQNFSEPTKELDAASRSGRLVHDGNPVLEWCIGNVVGRFDARGNVYPRKSRDEQKIDGAIATIMAMGTAIAEDMNAGSLDAFLAGPLSISF